MSVLNAAFIKYKYRWLQTCLGNLKSTKHLTFCIWQIFYEFLKIDNFPNFQIFQKSSAAHTKIIVYVLFYVNVFDKTPFNLMSPFSNDIFTNLVSTSVFNVKF